MIETARLMLRPPAEGDLEGWCALMSDEVAMRHLGGVKPRAVAWRSMAAVAGSWALRGYGMFSVIERATGRWIGRVGPWCPEGWPGTEVGWAILRDSWGRGYATEAAAASIEWAIPTLGWTDIVHVIDPQNAASAALAGRLGSLNRGPTRLPPPFEASQADLWGQTAAQWRAGRQTCGVSRGAPPGAGRSFGLPLPSPTGEGRGLRAALPPASPPTTARKQRQSSLR